MSTASGRSQAAEMSLEPMTYFFPVIRRETSEREEEKKILEEVNVAFYSNLALVTKTFITILPLMVLFNFR